MMELQRSGGILFHPTSLPSPYGVGDLGPAASRWLDWLEEAGCRLWQVLPLGPTGYADSPYQSLSAMAGNPLLISVELLLQEGLLQPEDVHDSPAFPDSAVDYGAVIHHRTPLLRIACQRFHDQADPASRAEFEAFAQAEKDWLDDHALFMSLKQAHGGAPWTEWDRSLARREPEALKAAASDLIAETEAHRFDQFLFRRQWAALRARAADKGITLIGDIPIFVAHDSVDVWAHPELFQLDGDGRPLVQAGVPPDYFSPTGQLWGNPLYRWDVMRDDGFAWWVRRFRGVLGMVDVVRLDHFRGFEACWEVPGGAETAEKGRWAPGPGASFFAAIQEALGALPILAEDLGEITQPVIELREAFGLPGMRILQFGFEGGPHDAFLPHNYVAGCAAYTGTHDNDTALGWYQGASDAHREFCRQYLGVDADSVAWGMVRACWGSVAAWALAPLQDVLGLDTSARMNLPGRPGGNWTWRVQSSSLTSEVAARLRSLSETYGRLPRKVSG